jgi:non-canonical purine NTP pyrophosphatase (RdgB/HAM1 family)
MSQSVWTSVPVPVFRTAVRHWIGTFMTLRFVSSNRDKIREASEILRRPLAPVSVEIEELQTTDLQKLVRHKAHQAYRGLRHPLIVEDTSLVFQAWRALPGPFIKYFLENLGLEGLVDALAPFENWDAQAISGVGYHDGNRVHYFEGRVAGRIVAPAGGGGFGWDPIFRPDGAERSFAEMEPEEKHRHSMRAAALKELAAYLDSPQARPRRAFTRLAPVPNPPGRPDSA